VAVQQEAQSAECAVSGHEYTYTDHLAELGMGNSASSEGGSPSPAPEMDPAAIGRVQGVTAAAKMPTGAAPKQRGPKASPTDYTYMKVRSLSTWQRLLSMRKARRASWTTRCVFSRCCAPCLAPTLTLVNPATSHGP
jgi:hypothetical protein